MTEAEQKEFIKVQNEHDEMKKDFRALVSIAVAFPKQLGIPLESFKSFDSGTLSAVAAQLIPAIMAGSVDFAPILAQFRPIIAKYAWMVEDLLPSVSPADNPATSTAKNLA